jgi:copper chaperone NosL
MLITDNKYGAEIVSDKGKTYKFDSIECLIGFALVKNLTGNQTHDFIVSDFSNPGNFTDARNANYVHNDNFRSPMGLNVSAFGDKAKFDKFISDNGGHSLAWVEVIELVKQKDM